MESVIDAEALKKVLSLSRKTIYHLIRYDQFPHLRVGGKFLFRLSEVEAWLDTKARGMKNIPPGAA